MHWFINCDKGITPVQDVNNRGNSAEERIYGNSTIFSTFYKRETGLTKYIYLKSIFLSMKHKNCDIKNKK